MELRTALFVLLCVLLNDVNTQSVAGPKPTMSKEQAAELCIKKNSSLLSYKRAKGNPSVHDYQTQLNDGESAWIEGYAKLSPFLSWQGCYNISRSRLGFRTVAIRYESISRCLGECHPSYTYIGLKDASCFCIYQNQRHQMHYGFVNDSFCSVPCRNNVVDSCGGHSYMAVYSILKDGTIHWGTNEPSSHLCVYVKRKVDHLNHFAAYTASCHTKWINGYICSNSAWSSLSTENCSSLSHLNMYCIQNVTSSRQDASERCYRRKGILTDLGSEGPTSKYLQYNFKYWIGIHRTFGISEQYKPTETVCLSATRLGDKFILEPDNCSAQKFYLCESEFSGKTETTPTLKTTTFYRDTENGTFLTTETQLELVTEGKAESPVPYIIPSILIVILIILVILCIVYRRNKKRKNETTQPIEDNYDAIYEADNMRNEYSVTSVSSMNADSKCLIVKTKPDKPERQTLKRRTAVSEYENCSLNLKTKDITNKKKEGGMRGHDDEYDKLKFNSVPQTVQYGPEEHNVYNHTMTPGNDNYDTMKSVKSFHSVDRIDETYSRMNEKLLPNDLCELQNSAEPLVNLEGIDNLSYSTQIEGSGELQKEVPPRRFIIIDDENENKKGQ